MTIINSNNMQPFVQDGSECFVNISGFYCAVELRRNKNHQNKICLIFCNFLKESERESVNSSNQAFIDLHWWKESKMQGYFLYFSFFYFSLLWLKILSYFWEGFNNERSTRNASKLH